MSGLAKYEFQNLEKVHFQTLFQWLQSPHVRTWWDSEDNWHQFKDRHERMIENPLVFPHVVFRNGAPIGFINYWFVGEDPDFRMVFPADTVGTDQFIGIPELVGKGIGSEFIRQFTNDLLLRPDIGLVITDPDSQNVAAIRCYEKAGFMKSRLMDTSEGKVQLLEKRGPQ